MFRLLCQPSDLAKASTPYVQSHPTYFFTANSQQHSKYSNFLCYLFPATKNFIVG